MKVLLLLILLMVAPAFSGTRIWKVREASDTDLFCSYNRLYGMSVTLQTTGPVDVTTSGHVNLKHRCLPGVTAVGYAVAIYVKYAPTLAGLESAGWTWLASGSGNIRDCGHHYQDVPLDSYARLSAPGWYPVRGMGEVLFV